MLPSNASPTIAPLAFSIGLPELPPTMSLLVVKFARVVMSRLSFSASHRCGTLNGGSQGGNGAALNGPEYDGYITLTAGSEKLSVPWHVLPRKAAETDADLSHHGDPGPSLKLRNRGAETGDYDVFTLAGVNMVVMVNAAVIIEVIFAWPGIGRLLYEGIFQRDFPLVQGVVIMAGFMIVGINLVVDVLYAFIDPRIRLTR